ncbi:MULTISPECIES: helix-turn-helix domain-containing protein [Bacillaceae]|uniref:winged helix-turn-helix transcriptional regulator n=1 Tax=Bacillaceae TaxID=186817 RepID=UPI001BDF5AA1|nr:MULTISPECIES: helix-turn-helix domain-containing protein [Bacillaceae]MDX8362695.1 helix-turn-helix domain-containing protein [Cytobacillus sp. IB215316]MDX8365577.1 helix-turn-helix domain-containing protein [Cytobacillus sp. IB215665]
MALSRKKPCAQLSKLEKILISIDGRYSPLLILALEKNHRFSDLLRRLPDANKQSLSTTLKQLMKYEIVFKDVIKESAPQHIEYGLTEKGKKIRGILLQMSEII